MKRKLYLPLLSVILTGIMLVGCGSNSSDSYSGYSESKAAYSEAAYDSSDFYSDYEPMEALEEADNSTAADAGEVSESAAEAANSRKLIRTVNMTAETYEFDDMTANIKAKTESLGGYMESSRISGDADAHNRYASYTLRIPAKSADSFIETIKGKSNIVEQSESMEDVTLTYVDIQSRKDSLQIEYDRLEELLKEATTTEELIYIENRLADVRYEIQSIESQLRTYDNKVNYTTIYLVVDEVFEYTAPVVTNPTFGERLTKGLKNAFENIWEGLQNFALFVIIAIPYLIVFAIPVVIIALIVNICVKKFNKKQEARKLEKQKEVQMGKSEAVDTSVPYTERAEKK